MTGLDGLDGLVTAAAGVLGRPAGDDDLAELRRRFATGVVAVLRCDACGHLRMPGARRCPECLALGGSWQEDAGGATIWSFAVYHRAFSPGFAAVVPYVVALVELDSGPRTITNVVGVEPADVRMGMRGRLRAVPVTEEEGLVYFVAEEDEH